MTTQFFVERDRDGWALVATNGQRQATVRRFADQGEAVRVAAAANARSLELAAPVRNTPTLAEAARLFDGLGATPIVDRNGRRYAVHHRNQFSD